MSNNYTVKDLSEAVDALKVLAEVNLQALHPEAVNFLKNLPEDTPLTIACSGGSDSLFLTLVILALFPERKKHLTLLHYNHKTRADASDSDELFVKAMAEALGINCITGQFDSTTKYKEKDKITARPEDFNELKLRHYRQQFFDEALNALGCDILLTGHQQDDVLEMMLMRLSRGSGTSGLCAPRPLHLFLTGKVHVRPLLTFSKGQIEEILKKVNISWREDVSNFTLKYYRNRIRQLVIPAWEQALDCCDNRDLLKAAAISRELLEEDDNALEFWLDEIWPELLIYEDNMQFPAIDLHILQQKPKAIIRRAIYRWIHSLEQEEMINLSRQAFETLLQMCLDGISNRMSVGTGFFLEIRDSKLFCFSLNEWTWDKSNLLTLTTTPSINYVFFPYGGVLEVSLVALNEQLINDITQGRYSHNEVVFLNMDKMLFGKSSEEKVEIHVRGWYEGDAYKALGGLGRKKLHDQFIDRKIINLHRKQLPVIFLDKNHDPVWVPGLPPADHYKILSTSQYALKLTYLSGY